MTVYAETRAALRWLFPVEGGEALRAVLATVASSLLTLIQTRRVVHQA